MEVDLLCAEERLVVELDGGQHLENLDAYRRDRRKDAMLQEHGSFSAIPGRGRGWKTGPGARCHPAGISTSPCVGGDSIAPGCDVLYDRQCERHVGRGDLYATDLNDAHGDRLPVGRSERVREATLPMKVNPS